MERRKELEDAPPTDDNARINRSRAKPPPGSPVVTETHGIYLFVHKNKQHIYASKEAAEVVAASLGITLDWQEVT
jgi:hypothetical protein